ncbi:MAG: type 1 glutamine amidotransferase domain-containing protein [Acidimicrobiales bacterium]
MSHANVNPVDPTHPKRVAIVIANPATSTTTGWPVGFWWSELTHPYYYLTEAGYQVDIFSPEGGRCEADAMSNPDDTTRWQAEDQISRGFMHDPDFMALIDNTGKVDDIHVADYDAIIVAGGQAPMFTFDTAVNLHHKFVEFYEHGKIAAALCHGTAILRYATLSNGEPLVRGKTVTGFPNVEEDFADNAVWEMGALPRDQHVMAWRIEDTLKELGANYIQAGLFKPFAIRDGNLLTGQQNFSGAEVARLLLDTLGR